jgi:hypothetical protein
MQSHNPYQSPTELVDNDEGHDSRSIGTLLSLSVFLAILFFIGAVPVVLRIIVEIQHLAPLTKDTEQQYRQAAIVCGLIGLGFAVIGAAIPWVTTSGKKRPAPPNHDE